MPRHNHVTMFQSENEISYKVARLYQFSFFNLSLVLPHTTRLYGYQHASPICEVVVRRPF